MPQQEYQCTACGSKRKMNGRTNGNPITAICRECGTVRTVWIGTVRTEKAAGNSKD